MGMSERGSFLERAEEEERSWMGKGGEGDARNWFTNHDQPFWLLDALRIGLRVSKAFPFGVFGLFDFVRGAVADEDGFAAPFDDYL